MSFFWNAKGVLFLHRGKPQVAPRKGLKEQRLFCCDWWEAYVISNSCGMGDPLAPSEVEGNSGGGRHHPSVTV